MSEVFDSAAQIPAGFAASCDPQPLPRTLLMCRDWLRPASPLTPWHGVPSVSNGHSKMAHMQDFDFRVSPDGSFSKPLPWLCDDGGGGSAS